jgi:hypothetical protein
MSQQKYAIGFKPVGRPYGAPSGRPPSLLSPPDFLFHHVFIECPRVIWPTHQVLEFLWVPLHVCPRDAMDTKLNSCLACTAVFDQTLLDQPLEPARFPAASPRWDPDEVVIPIKGGAQHFTLDATGCA